CLYQAAPALTRRPPLAVLAEDDRKPVRDDNQTARRRHRHASTDLKPWARDRKRRCRDRAIDEEAGGQCDKMRRRLSREAQRGEIPRRSSAARSAFSSASKCAGGTSSTARRRGSTASPASEAAAASRAASTSRGASPRRRP